MYVGLHADACEGSRVVGAELLVEIFEIAGDGHHCRVVGGEYAFGYESL